MIRRAETGTIACGGRWRGEIFYRATDGEVKGTWKKNDMDVGRVVLWKV